MWIGGKPVASPRATAPARSPIRRPARSPSACRSATPPTSTRRSRPRRPRCPAWRDTPPLRRARVMQKFLAAAAGEPEGARAARHRGARQDAARRDGLGAARHRGGRVRLRHPAPAEGRVLARTSARGVDTHTLRQPVGVCAGITPFNFPAMVPLWMFPVAIACGNTFILKPSEKVPSASMRMAELFKEAGLPDGVFNVVHGDKEAVDAILAHPGIHAVSFVGSTPIAKYIYETCAQQRQARAGARRREEPRRGAARRRSGVHRRRADRRRLRLGGRALHGDLGGGRGRRGGRSAGRAAQEEGASRSRSGRATRRRHGHGAARHDAAPRQGRGLHRQGRRRKARSSCVDGRGLVVPGHEDGFFLGTTLFDHVKPGDEDLPGRDLRAGAGRAARADARGGDRAGEREPVRQRHRDLHRVRRRGAALRERDPGRHGRHQRADPGAGRVLLVRRLEELAVRRPARARHGGRQVLHPHQGRSPRAGRTRTRRRPASTCRRSAKRPDAVRSSSLAAQ